MCEFDCDEHPARDGVDPEIAGFGRRSLLLRGAAAATAGLASPLIVGAGTAVAKGPPRPVIAPVEVRPGLLVHPRDTWGWDLRPKSTFAAEDVRFLLVHHTATPNTYGDEIPRLRSIYAFHTRTRKWNDVCYQFFIGRTGEIWEGRAGALAGPVVADATGGSQGFAQLVCLLGDYSRRTPSAAMQDSLVKVLAWMADRYNVDTAPGASTTFVSRGSNKWPKGATITTPTIAGHRDMTRTTCPGTVAYSMIPSLRTRVHAQRQAWSTT